MQTTHTPGPWTIENVVWLEDPVLHPAGGQRHTIIGAECGTLALVLDDEGDPECPANVKLIAASPRMHDALKAIASMKPNDDTDHAQLSALCIAIAKATLDEIGDV